MNEVVYSAQTGLEGCSTTGDIRRLSASLYRGVKDKSKDNVFGTCEALLAQRDWAMGVIAFDFAHRVKKQYDDDTFDVFAGWLEKYVRGWGDCDDFCTHAFGELIRQSPGLFERIIPWTKQEAFWMRRAAAVVLIPSIWHEAYKGYNPLLICDLLMADEHDLVRKGYGWMLKILSYKEPQLVYDYLVKNRDVMPRVAFRYAIEKMDKEKRDALMRL